MNVSTKQNNYIYFYHANLQGQRSYCVLQQWYQDNEKKQNKLIIGEKNNTECVIATIFLTPNNTANRKFFKYIFQLWRNCLDVLSSVIFCHANRRIPTILYTFHIILVNACKVLNYVINQIALDIIKLITGSSRLQVRFSSDMTSYWVLSTKILCILKQHLIRNRH